MQSHNTETIGKKELKIGNSIENETEK